MPKRKADDRIQYYESKIQKLREKQRPARIVRRRVIYSTSSSDENLDNETSPQHETPTVEVEVPTEAPPSMEEIDGDFLSALGDTTQEVEVYGERIHDTLAQRWLPILRRGIGSKEARETLLKEQKIPENCKFLKAPTLNPEISAAVTDSARSRDKKIENHQNQLGLGITAVNRAMNLLVTGGEDKSNKVQAVKILSDACRILSDLHYMDTQSRINLITPALDKSFISIIKDVERDESLFGSKLSEKIKASKAIEKQGLQIKKSLTPQKTLAPSTSQSTYRTRYQGNWTVPSRYQPMANRGGKGGQKTPSTSQKPAIQTSTTHVKNNKQRAPPRL